MYLQAGSLFANHWNRNSWMAVKAPMWIHCVCPCRAAVCRAQGHPAEPQPSGAPGVPHPCGDHPALLPSPLQLQEGANRTWSLRPPFITGLPVTVPGIRHNLFCNKTKWVQNQIFKVSTSKANEWLKLGLIIDPSTCGSKVRPKLNNYFSEIIFD